MLIIGCDYHPGFQQIAFVDTETGELGERRLVHCEEAEQFYGKLREQSVTVRVGMEARGHPGLGLRAVQKVRFARGRARTSRWCAINHRRNDWASRSPKQGSSNT
jgi:hypothetical protein